MEYTEITYMQNIHTECERLLGMIHHYKSTLDMEQEMDIPDQSFIDFFTEQIDRYETTYAQKLAEFTKYSLSHVQA